MKNVIGSATTYLTSPDSEPRATLFDKSEGISFAALRHSDNPAAAVLGLIYEINKRSQAIRGARVDLKLSFLSRYLGQFDANSLANYPLHKTMYECSQDFRYRYPRGH